MVEEKKSAEEREVKLVAMVKKVAKVNLVAKVKEVAEEVQWQAMELSRGKACPASKKKKTWRRPPLRRWEGRILTGSCRGEERQLLLVVDEGEVVVEHCSRRLTVED